MAYMLHFIILQKIIGVRKMVNKNIKISDLTNTHIKNIFEEIKATNSRMKCEEESHEFTNDYFMKKKAANARMFRPWRSYSYVIFFSNVPFCA
jgi:hypothetical protein